MAAFGFLPPSAFQSSGGHRLRGEGDRLVLVTPVNLITEKTETAVFSDCIRELAPLLLARPSLRWWKTVYSCLLPIVCRPIFRAEKNETRGSFPKTGFYYEPSPPPALTN